MPPEPKPASSAPGVAVAESTTKSSATPTRTKISTLRPVTVEFCLSHQRNQGLEWLCDRVALSRRDRDGHTAQASDARAERKDARLGQCWGMTPERGLEGTTYATMGA